LWDEIKEGEEKAIEKTAEALEKAEDKIKDLVDGDKGKNKDKPLVKYDELNMDFTGR
jgi:hypothetical protein